MTQSLVPFQPTVISGAWDRLTPTRKVALAAVVVAAVVALILLVTWSSTPEYQVAFTDLKAKDGAAVVQYLKDNNISYKISDGGKTVMVPADQVYEVRLALAADGLPAQGTVGFELFDTINIGMTDFIQQVDYQRALEGELARTISSMTPIQSARVHIVIPKPTLFAEEQKPTTASVVVELKPGEKLSREQVRAISHLVSSAVEGLVPENLAILDTGGRVLSEGAATTASAPVALSASQLEVKRAFERDMESRIQAMLETVVGPGRAIVGVTADMNWDQVQTDNEIYKPTDEGNALRSSQVITEAYTGSGAVPGGIPGTASNIPSAAPSYQTTTTGETGNSYLRNETVSNYEVSKSLSRVVAATGQLKRLSISVMVDNITDTTTLEAIQPAVVAAAGIDFDRGDVITVSNVAFDRTYYAEQRSAVEAAQQRDFILKLAQWAAVAVALVALFFAARGIQRALRPAPAAVEIAGKALPAESVPEDVRAALLKQMERLGSAAEEDLTQLPSVKTIGPPTFDAEAQAAAERAQMIRQLQLMAKNRPQTMAQIIQFWLAEDKK